MRGSRWQTEVRRLKNGDVAPAMESICAMLAELRASEGASALRALGTDPDFLELRAILHEDPYTRRGFQKPRRYPGDAVLLDLIYGLAPLPEPTTEIGEAIFDWCQAHSAAFHSVKFRRDYFAREIDAALADSQAGPVISVACGHLREAHLSAHLLQRQDQERLIALDADPVSLRVVQGHFGGRGVRTVIGSVKQILTGRAALPVGCSLIYAAGLYDYLRDDVVSALTRTLLSHLAPGGKLVVPHFTGIREAGYIEACMDWWLIYRDANALEPLVGGHGLAAEYFVDPFGNVTYAVLQKH